MNNFNTSVGVLKIGMLIKYKFWIAQKKNKII